MSPVLSKFEPKLQNQLRVPQGDRLQKQGQSLITSQTGFLRRTRESSTHFHSLDPKWALLFLCMKRSLESAFLGNMLAGHQHFLIAFSGGDRREKAERRQAPVFWVLFKEGGDDLIWFLAARSPPISPSSRCASRSLFLRKAYQLHSRYKLVMFVTLSRWDQATSPHTGIIYTSRFSHLIRIQHYEDGMFPSVKQYKLY